MSNSLSIAAVTATLRNILATGLKPEIPNDVNITAKPLDKTRNDSTANQLNIFLYQTLPNAALSNTDMPGVRPGETAYPPLAINLFYMLTAYGEGDDDLKGHRVLGRAMSVIHDHPILSRQEIKTALPGNDLHLQVEGIKISPQPLSVDDLSKLWNTFQTQYRISAAYEATVILIESNRSTKTPLPVLTRGKDDSGVVAQPDLIPPFPTLESVTPPNAQTVGQPGDTISLNGHHLDADQVFVRLSNDLLKDPGTGDPVEFRELAPLPGPTESTVEFVFPDIPDEWPAGFYRISVRLVRAADQERISNQVSLSIAPIIETILKIPAGNKVNIQIACKPAVLPNQRSSLLLADLEIPAESHATATQTLNFLDAPQGTHFVRLRVDGVDSILVDRSVTPPVFFDDDKHKVTIP